MSQVVRRQECAHFTASRSILQKLFPLIFLYVVVALHNVLLLCVFSVLQSVTTQGNWGLTVMGVFTPQKLVSTTNQGFLARRATCWIFIGSLLLFPSSKTLGKPFTSLCLSVLVCNIGITLVPTWEMSWINELRHQKDVLEMLGTSLASLNSRCQNYSVRVVIKLCLPPDPDDIHSGWPNLNLITLCLDCHPLGLLITFFLTMYLTETI